MSLHLLIVDDDAALAQLLALHFQDQGYDASVAGSCAAGLEALRAAAVDMVLLDQHLPDGTGLDLLRRLRSEDPELPVIMMTGVHDLDLAIQAIKEGALDFVHKPVKTQELEHVMGRALESRRLKRELKVLQEEPPYPRSTSDFIGRGEAMLKVSKEIALTAGSRANVLITGESGTGKEVVARLIHTHSGLDGPFVAVNCAAIVETLLESELFGHEKGAFTGASERKLGKFELARDGTLFLDEIGELALPLQAKLLRVLQEGVFERVGGNQRITTNARIIAATNRDLHEEVREKHFREDLLYRLNVVAIHLPPLRDRPEDIPLLSEALMAKASKKIHKTPLHITDGAARALLRYPWPGNVRELENVLTQAMVHARDGLLTPELLPLAADRPQPTAPADSDAMPQLTLDEVEAAHIQRVLNHTGGHKGKSCDILGISRPALDRKIAKYQLVLPRE